MEALLLAPQNNMVKTANNIRSTFFLRLPHELKLKLQAAGLTQKRSLNAEIVKRLEDSFRDSYRTSF